HGGGFVTGSIASHDSFTRVLAAEARTVVVSVEYRLAPEDPFPAAPEDAEASFRWCRARASELRFKGPFGVGGDSAGGNLAAVVSQSLRGESVAPDFQLLIYPAADFRRGFPSHQTFAKNFIIDRRTLDWFIANYLGSEGSLTDPRASPLLADSFVGLPPALLVIAGFDPLRDEGEAYGDALEGAGVPIRRLTYGTLPHGFLQMAGAVDRAHDANLEIARGLRDLCASVP
ncbi:MAG: alpha/beta hydrolase, partial [Myxococcota bacterium]